MLSRTFITLTIFVLIIINSLSTINAGEPKYMPGDAHPDAGAFDATHELLVAAEKGKAHRINQVLDHGAGINARNNNGVSALIYAANNGHVEASKLLLDRGADIEARSNDAKTPLLWACFWGHFEVVKLLLERGADINAFDHDGMTAVMFATKGGHTPIVEYLIEMGADVHVSNFYNGTALTIARVKGFVDLENILDPYFPEELTSNPYVLLIYQAYYGILRKYKLFLRSFRHYTGLHPTAEMTEDEL